MFNLNLLLEDSARLSCPLDATKLQSVCNKTLAKQDRLALDVIKNIELSVQLLDPPAMRDLNKQYRNKDSATNVLSFESQLPPLTPLHSSNEEQSGALFVLGDLVFCPKVIDTEAAEQAKPVKEHWVHMLVHGTLHLCGYDHIEAGDAQIMEDLEVQILSTFGLPDPYRKRTD